MLQSMGSRRVRHNRATNQQQQHLSPLLMFEIFPILMGQRFPSPQKLKVPSTNFPTSLVVRECACYLESAKHLFLGGFPGGSDGKIICLQCWRPGFNPWVRKIPWRRDWQLQYSCLENSMDGGSMGSQSLTRLSNFAFTFTFRHLYPRLQIRS